MGCCYLLLNSYIRQIDLPDKSNEIQSICAKLYTNNEPKHTAKDTQEF